MHLDKRLDVRPLGVFGILATQAEWALRADELRSHVGEIPEKQRQLVAEYLRAGRIIFALMEHTTDVIGAQFGTPGGSAIQTDGVHYWRCDAADYVARYGIGLPYEFLERETRLGWQAPVLSDESAIAIDRWLYEHIQRAGSRQ